MKRTGVVWLLIFICWTTIVLGESFLVICGKQITVNGETNIGSFSCHYTIHEPNDTLFLSQQLTEGKRFAFSLEVPDFSCGNFLLNKDFQETLCADQYPEITIKVLKIYKSQLRGFRGDVELNMVGKEKVLKDLHFILEEESDTKTLNTNFIITASEFELTLPRRFGGLITAEDCIGINVNLNLL